MTQVAPRGRDDEGAPARHAEHQILGHQFLEGTSDGLPAHGVLTRDLRFGGQRGVRRERVAQDLRPKVAPYTPERWSRFCR